MKLARVSGKFTLPDVASFDFSDYVAQEKIDGWRAAIDCDTGALTGRNAPLGFFRGRMPAGCAFDGELVKDTFYAFDLLKLNGQDVSGEPLVWRLQQLDTLRGDFEHVRWSHDCAKLAKTIDGEGGEGVVAKLRNAPYKYGGWLRFKREMTADFRVAAIHAASLELIDANGVNIGRVQGSSDAVTVGCWVEIKAMHWTENRKLRHGRLVRVRPDLAQAF